MRYLRPASCDEALGMLSAPDTRIVAGGTDVYPALRDRAPRFDMVDVTGIADLRKITQEDDWLRIGAAATWSELIRHPLPPAFDGLKAAAREVGSVQIQNAGTVAGNLCNASPAADGVPPLLTLDAEVEVAGPEGARRLPLGDFILGPRRTALAPGEMVTAVLVPEPPAGAVSAFAKLGSRTYLVISIAMVSVLATAAEGRIAEARVAVGACSPVAVRLSALEADLAGRPVADLNDLGLVTSAHLAPLSPLSDVRGSAAYRVDAVGTLVRRALLAALEGRNG